MAKRKGRERTDRLIALLSDPSSFDDLLSFVAEGGTVFEWAQQHDVRSGEVRLWALADPDRAKRFADAEVSRETTLRDRTLATLRDVATADIRTAYDQSGAPLGPHQLPATLAASLVGYEQTTDEDGNVKTKVKFTPRERGAELLGRHLSMFKDRVALEGPVTVTVKRLTETAK